MKKRVFYQLRKGWLISLACLIIFPVSILVFYIYIVFTSRNFDWRLFIMVFMIQLGFIIFVLGMQVYGVSFHDTHIYVPNLAWWKSTRIQYKDQIEYDKILSVRMTRSSKNSLGLAIESGRLSAGILKAYIEFEYEGEKTKRIVVMNHSKKQWAKIIDEIKLRMKSVGNNAVLMDTAEMIAQVGKSGVEIG